MQKINQNRHLLTIKNTVNLWINCIISEKSKFFLKINPLRIVSFWYKVFFINHILTIVWDENREHHFYLDQKKKIVFSG